MSRSPTKIFTVTKVRRTAVRPFGQTEIDAPGRIESEKSAEASQPALQTIGQTNASIDDLLAACSKIALSDRALDRKSVLVEALLPAYELLRAAEGDAAASERILQKAGTAKGPKRDLALACALLIVAPDNLKARKAASEYAAMLRYAKERGTAVGAFTKFAAATSLRDAKAAGVRRKSKVAPAGFRLHLRLCQGTATISGPSRIEIPADIAPALQQALVGDNLQWPDFANLLLASITSADPNVEEASYAQS